MEDNVSVSTPSGGGDSGQQENNQDPKQPRRRKSNGGSDVGNKRTPKSEKKQQQQQQQERRGRQNEGNKSNNPKKAVLSKLSMELTSLRERLSRLYHITKLAIQYGCEQETSPDSLNYIIDNPDEILDPLSNSKPLLKHETMMTIANDPERIERVGKMKSSDLDWSKNEDLAAWVLSRGLNNTVKTMKRMYNARVKLEQRLSGKPANKTPVKPVVGKNQPQQHQQDMSNNTPSTTKKKKNKQQQQQQQQQQTNTPKKYSPSTPPPSSATNHPAFAWASFQNSPDPSELPIPRFVKNGAASPKSNLNAAFSQVLGVPCPPPHVGGVGHNNKNSISKEKKARNQINPSPIRGGASHS